MKREILAALQRTEDYVSGQELCSQLGVSRTAVWKVVNQLREDGYEIESVPHKGYRILSSPDHVTAEQIGSVLTTVWAGKEIHYFETTDSTNNEARKLAEHDAPHGTLVLADFQESGKGRRGRTWTTPKGTSVMMSLVVRPRLLKNSAEAVLTDGSPSLNSEQSDQRENLLPASPEQSALQSVSLPPERASMMTLVMGMAVAAAVSELCGGSGVSIKWPNDVIADGKKLCGILTEMSCEIDYINYLVIGTGINVNLDEFPEELRQKATSLYLLTGRKVSRASLTALCLKKFEYYYGRFMETQDMSLLREEYNAWLAGKGSAVRVLEPGHEYDGISRGINERGELLVELEDGTVRQVYAGEVSVRGIYGYV